jgi:glycosyltransferase involved in cell wall biosynthesis
MFSTVILTLNEEKALPGCLASLGECDDIVVLDSGSSDRTVAIAEAAGARVFTRAFDGFASQRNFAQREIPFRHPWVFHLDADERMTPALAAECVGAAAHPDVDGYRASPKALFEGRWIRHCTDYPAYQARFVRAPGFEFIQVGHGQREALHLMVQNLRQSYLHDISIYGQEAWLEKHRRYARDEAANSLAADPSASFGALFSPNALTRRRALKRFSFFLPFRPALRFGYQYILRGGFLDGGPGLRYCLLLARYEGFIADERNRLKRTT